MEVKVAVPTLAPSPLDTNKLMMMRSGNNGVDSNCSTPYMSAPSSPQRPINLFFLSAPPSPRSSSDDRLSLLAGDDGPPSPSAVVPFRWELIPGVPKANGDHHCHNHGDGDGDDEDDDFEFEFSGQLDGKLRDSLSSADELFAGGKIRPLKPPPPMSESPRSPRSPISKFREALSPRQRNHHRRVSEDPFEAALKNSAKSDQPDCPPTRGRSSNPNPAGFRANSRKGISRSLSPLRVSEFALLQNCNPEMTSSSSSSSSSLKSGTRKWRLKDFLLFRSASEGRATTSGKDPLKRFFPMSGSSARRGEEGRSFRSSTEGPGSGSVSRRRERASAHELHYTANRAVTEEMKKKTTLPYKHGLLGCLGFNHGINDISKAFGSLARY